jgi:hypothetical protein
MLRLRCLVIGEPYIVSFSGNGCSLVKVNYQRVNGVHIGKQRYGAKLDGKHCIRMVIGRDCKSLGGDEVELVGMVTETIVIDHQRFATVSTNRGYIWP